MSNCDIYSVKLSFLPGSEIGDCIRFARSLSELIGNDQVVEFDFNGIKMRVSRSSDVNDVCSSYLKRLNRKALR